MSIHKMADKIKSHAGIDRKTVIFLLIIVAVGLASFGLGRLSLIYNNLGVNDANGINEPSGGQVKDKTDTKQISDITTAEAPIKMYVASKNGKIYYSIGCNEAKRIKQENQVWFGSKEDAEKEGYTESSMCK